MAEEYLDSISKKSKDVSGRNNEADFRDRWRKQLSIAIQSCNSRVILKNCPSYPIVILMTTYMIVTFSTLFTDLFVCFL